MSKTLSNENLTLYLKGIKYEQLSLLMSFMYSGSIEMPEPKVLRFCQDDINIADVTPQTNKVSGHHKEDCSVSAESPDEEPQQSESVVDNDEMKR